MFAGLLKTTSVETGAPVSSKDWRAASRVGASNRSSWRTIMTGEASWSDALIIKFGSQKFKDFAERAWAYAAQTGYGDPEEYEEQGEADFELASDMVETICESEVTNESKISLVFQLYRRAPSYTLLSELYVHYLWEINRRIRNFFWSEMLNIISDDDERFANPALYLLWCGPFEEEQSNAEKKEITRHLFHGSY